MGVSIAIDDFGTGYSSLSHLNELPADIIKIDRSFVSGKEGLGISSKSESLIRAVLDIARSLELGVVAEGVETESQARRLQALGCGLAQGWLYGRPAKADTTWAKLRGLTRR